MMRDTRIMNKMVLAIICANLLLACQQQSTDLSMPALAKVDGEPITRSVLDAYLAQQGIAEPTPEQTGTALQNLIQLYAVSNQAKNSEVINDPLLRARLELQQRRMLFEAAASNYAERFPTSDVDLERQYQQTVKETGRLEYRLNAINFGDQQAALQAIVDIQAATKRFDAFAAGTGDTVEVADLGWVTLSNLPANAADAIRKTAVNKVAAVPVQTAAGWSVLQVAETRNFTPPPFDEVKEGIRRDLNRKKVEAWVESVRERAAVELENVTVAE